MTYHTTPVTLVDDYAKTKSIEAYGDCGKYQLNFKTNAEKIKPIPLGEAHKGAMQSSRYTSLTKLLSAKSLVDLF